MFFVAAYEKDLPAAGSAVRSEKMKAKPFTITDVGALLGVQRLSGGNEDSYNVVCPFCGDERGKCNFILIKNGELVNVYHCFHCGAGGNMLTLYAELNGIYGETVTSGLIGRYRKNCRWGCRNVRCARNG